MGSPSLPAENPDQKVNARPKFRQLHGEWQEELRLEEHLHKTREHRL